jgi:hypothetical protein
MHDPDGKGCVFCPQDTLVTGGRHFPSIIDWCEADCYKALSQMMQMDYYTRGWYIWSFANVPCVSSMYIKAQVQTATGNVENIEYDAISRETVMKQCKRGDEDCKQLKTKCSSLDIDSWVKNSVMRWRGPDFPKGAESGNRYRVPDAQMPRPSAESSGPLLTAMTQSLSGSIAAASAGP